MDSVCRDAHEFIVKLFDLTGLRLSVEMRSEQRDCYLNFVGEDAVWLIASAGQMLDSVEYIANKAYSRQLEPGARIICDANGYRATRESELRAMALHAAERVRQTRQPFVFAPMSANERRVIHKVLAEDSGVATESVDDGPHRRLRVVPQ